MIYEARPDRNPGIALFQGIVFGLVALPVMVVVVLHVLGLGWLSLVGGAIAAVIGYRVWRSSSKPRKIILRVREKKLFVIDGKRSFELAVSALRNVSLDKKEVRKLRDGSPILPELMMVNSTVDATTEIVRVVLEGNGTSFRLTDEYQPYSAGLEGMGKVRVFLRKHGWVPPEEQWGELPPDKPRKPRKAR
ncbi:hypothetical protein BH09MYX1_BH09MYX1_57390 [soil metagenome]